ncbi:MAG: alpha/beta hydrolase [Weeksellaceae bacterium]|nr:alpha/beta hydrolase [Weeksellaceae bacterium]
MISKNWIYYILLAVFFTACSASHNVPQSQVPNNFINPNITSVFVDQNGNFFPNQWKDKYGQPKGNATRKEFSLMKIAAENGNTDDLTKFENSQLKGFADRVKNKKRIIIFIHGINNNYMESLTNYNKARTLMDLNNQKDEVVNFYWDGLKSNNIFGTAKVWVSATTNSQLAGEYGLRRILNAVNNKEIYIISHSRGAAVVMSALKNPVLNEVEKRIATKHHYLDIQKVEPLKENNNKIYSIMLAPAIGVKDFKEDDGSFKVFSDQLKSISSTINNTDFVLGKGKTGILSSSFTSTDFGFNPETFEEISKQYQLCDYTDFTGQKSHNFKDYITNPKFKEILRKFKLAK